MNGETGSDEMSLPESANRGTAPLADTAIATLRRVWRVLARWSDRRRQRLHLNQLDDHLLGDIGVTRAQARREASRWFFE